LKEVFEMGDLVAFRTREQVAQDELIETERNLDQKLRRENPLYSKLVYLASSLPHWEPAHQEDRGIVVPRYTDVELMLYMGELTPPEELKQDYSLVWRRVPDVIIRKRARLLNGPSILELLHIYRDRGLMYPLLEAADIAFVKYALQREARFHDHHAYMNVLRDFGKAAYLLYGQTELTGLGHEMSRAFTFLADAVRELCVLK